MSQTQAPVQGVIDLHSHWFSPSSLRFLSERQSSPRLLPGADGAPNLHRSGAGTTAQPFALGNHWFDLDARIEHFDQVGVAHQLLSWPTTLGIDAALSASESLGLWRDYNNELAGVVRQYPTRLSAVAALSTSDIQWSVGELQRAHEELGLIGAVLPVNAFASLAAASRFEPLLAKAQELGSHLYLHTGYAHPQVPGQPPVLLHSDAIEARRVLDIAWQFASATITLAHSDLLDRYPDVTVQIAMLGGAGIIANLVELSQVPGHFDAVGHSPRYQRLLFDTGAAGRGAQAIALATRVLGAEQLVFGSDYAPVPDIAPGIAQVLAAPISAAERELILRGNGQRLLASKGISLGS